jgi:hypothetical protein
MERTEETTQPSNPNEAVVTLDKPITRGSNTHESLTLRKPSSGELRGVSLLELMQMDVQALSKVLPRISSPSLTAQEVNAMDPADLLACGVAVSGFLLQKSAKEASLAA